MSTLVTYSLDDGIATITLDDGKRNVLSPAMLAELNAALDRAHVDQAIIVMTGRAGAFSAGFDLQTLTAGGTAAVGMLIGGFEFAERLLSYPRPIVMACSGHALAMGVFVLLCGDYSIGIDGAYKIGANEVAIGLTMPYTAIEICRNRLAPAHFGRAMTTSEIFTPTDAVAAGFLDRVVAEAELASAARNTALAFAKLNGAAHTGTKTRIREQLLRNIRTAIEADHASFRAMYGLA